MRPFNVLDPDCAILGNHFLEASAGTGKTFAIEHLVVRLLLEEEKKITIDQILVVTFTRAATRELKMRIRSNLEKASREKKEVIERALSSFDEAQIFTIHGFCHRMLSDFAFDAGLGFGIKDPHALSHRSLLSQLVRDFLRTGVKEDLYSEKQLSILLKKYRQDIEQLIAQVIYLIESGTEIASQSDFRSEENPLKILLQIASACKRMWEKEADRDAFAPDELLKKMHASLANRSFVEKVRQKYRAVIIDEFQDTDPIQWAIFKQLFLEEKGLDAFYLVGDPKQSIYAFRSADIYTYLNAAQAIGNTAFLTTNHRSSGALVRALNAFFSSSVWLDLPTLAERLPFHPVDAAQENEEGALRFFIARAEPTREKKWPPSSLEESHLFPFIAREALRFPDLRIAVLVKDRYQAEAVHTYFTRLGMRSLIKRGIGLQELPEFAALEEILWAVEDRENLSQLKSALGSSLIGWSAEELMQENKIASARLLFKELHLIWKQKGFAFFFQKFSQLFPVQIDSSLAQLLERILSSPQDPLSFLKAVREGKEPVEVVGEESPGDIIIMTTHMSKGLEFDIVFALGVASRHSAKEDFVRVKQELIPYEAEDDRCALALRELEAEKLRQLYVALTRAKKYLYVPIILAEQAKNHPLSPLELFLQKAINGPLEEHLVLAFLKNLASQERVDLYRLEEKIALEKIESPLDKREVREPLITHYKSELILSFSSFFKDRVMRPTDPAEEELPTGAITGTIVHGILEKIVKNGLHSPYDKEGCQRLIEEQMRGTRLESWHLMVGEMVEKALHFPLKDFALVDIPSHQMLAEMEFLFPLQGGEIIKGIADLCFARQDKYYFLDWKTNWLSDYSQPSLERVMEESAYFQQARLYAEALKRYVKLFDNTLTFGGAFYLFLRGPSVYHFLT